MKYLKKFIIFAVKKLNHHEICKNSFHRKIR